MNGEEPLGFFWPDVGLIEITPEGSRRVAIRFTPSEEAVLKGAEEANRGRTDGGNSKEGRRTRAGRKHRSW